MIFRLWLKILFDSINLRWYQIRNFGTGRRNILPGVTGPVHPKRASVGHCAGNAVQEISFNDNIHYLAMKHIIIKFFIIPSINFLFVHDVNCTAFFIFLFL